MDFSSRYKVSPLYSNSSAVNFTDIVARTSNYTDFHSPNVYYIKYANTTEVVHSGRKRIENNWAQTMNVEGTREEILKDFEAIMEAKP